ncbi:MAG: hypothetical protein RL265_177 [Bacteroidota bacterium]
MYMRFIIFLSATIFLFGACSSDKQTASDQQDSSDSKKKIAQLEKDNASKDSMLNLSLAYFSDIQSNLEAIELKKDEIRIISANTEVSSDDKTWILEQIRHINYLREENAKKVGVLNKLLDKNGIRILELEKLIQNMIQNIQIKDEQISVLQGELGSMDKAYAKLFDAYQEKSEMVDELKETLNTAFYSYGTESELVKNQVIERKNGFIGIGKKIYLSENFNEKYFAKIDLTEEKELFIEGSDVKFITDHPSKSYTLVPVGKNTKIKISNPREFWKVSNYLVVVVD